MYQVSILDAEGSGDCRSGVFKVAEVDAVGDKKFGGTKTVNVGALLEVFFGGLLRLWTVFFNCQSLWISRLSASRLKEFYYN
jgi:hypothetical protein